MSVESDLLTQTFPRRENILIIRKDQSQTRREQFAPARLCPDSLATSEVDGAKNQKYPQRGVGAGNAQGQLWCRGQSADALRRASPRASGLSLFGFGIQRGGLHFN